MKLVIVESPAKAKTIQKYLGRGFTVKSSYGHVRDLPKSKLGVDVDHDFEPQYVIPAKARPRVKDLKSAAAKADEIYFATDEDREGEAIAWHLAHILGTKPNQVKRITFAEITKGAITKAIEQPRALDANLVDAQQARRVLDRLVGYELSPLLWRKVRRGLSAGRVQSVATRLIVEREEEIKAFIPQEYWSITAFLSHNNSEFTANLTASRGEKIAKLDIKTKADAENIVRDVTGVNFTVANVEAKDRKRTPPAPFTTSTLQQAAVNTLGYSSKKAMMIAQQLYEGVEIGDEGPVGLITYMRTDSTNLATEATALARQAIEYTFGKEYALAEPRIYKTKSRGAQEAHEAIRPTDPSRTPEQVEAYLDPAQFKVYRLIWQRMVASQMAEARLKQVSADITAAQHTFRATGSTVVFDGYLKVYGEKGALKETFLPELKKGDTPAVSKIVPEQHFTEPKPRYSEASLVKALEEHGIGRPSTYAPTIETIQRREYVIKGEDKRFAPTEIGTIVTNLLKEHFPNIVDINFTASMENSLDDIASGDKEWRPVMQAFYQPFHETIQHKDKEINKSDIVEEKTGEKCPDCNNELIIKLGRFGKFKACSNYPDCKHTEPIGEEKKLEEQASNEICPNCGKPMALKRGRFGPFLGCTGYPECKTIKKIEKSTGVTCPSCNQGEIIEKKSRKGKTFFACNRYPDCKTAFWSKPTGEKCPQCQSLLVFGAKNTIRCSSKECSYQTSAET